MTEQHDRPERDEEPGAPPSVPAVELLGVVREATDRLGSVASSGDELWRLSEEHVKELLAAGQQVRAAQERVLHAVVREALARGMHSTMGLTAAELVGVHCPWLPAAEQRRVARVAQAADRVGYRPVVEAVAQGRLCTERADRLLTQLGRLRRYVEEARCAEYAAMLLPLAEMGADRQLRIAVEHLLALVTPEQDAETLAKARRESCTVYESSLADGMKRFIIEADPEGAALLRAVFSSRLTRPEDDEAGADLRPAGRRRYDALAAVVRRGMTAPDPQAPCGAPVQMLVTLPFDVLAGRVGAYGAAELGAGELECLTPGQLRRLACEAELVPFVLGGRSEVLDEGRRRRLATPAQRRALWIRDRACTFPGCSMPAQWTEVHHARVWWSRGGNTDLADMALLCRRHHTWVHSHDPEVTMTGRGPVWHLDRCHGRGTGEQATLHTDQPPESSQSPLDAFGLPRASDGGCSGEGTGVDDDGADRPGADHDGADRREQAERTSGGEGPPGTAAGRRPWGKDRRRDSGPGHASPTRADPGPQPVPTRASGYERQLSGWITAVTRRRRRHRNRTGHPPTPGSGPARPPPGRGRA